jgi:sugar phosphate isomerase/epimerase
MRLGGPVFGHFSTPDEWAAAHRAKGYGAALCPLGEADDAEAVRAYRDAAGRAGLVMAEVGAWSNPLSPDEAERNAALQLCRRRLALADEIGARCCVNIAGSRGEKWDGPHRGDLTDETFELIVESVRSIIDAVRPSRAFYTLETMPWMYPDSADSYLELIRAVDRERFAVHLDPVNLVNSPRRYFENASLLRECFGKLGPHMRSCHAKDVRLDDRLTVHLDEVRPGLGGLDYGVFLRELDRLDPDTPLVLEHLSGEEEYDAAAAHVRQVAEEVGVTIR